MKIESVQNKAFKNAVLTMKSSDFEDLAMEAFKLQAAENEIYAKYLFYLKRNPLKIQKIEQIPFLPIEFFKTQDIRTGNAPVETVFLSSGTTGERSRHLIADLAFYKQISKQIFEKYYGEIANYRIIALLPSYLAQGQSSLVAMVNHFLNFSRKDSFFSLDVHEVAAAVAEDGGENTLIFGVSYALLDFVALYQAPKAICIETGGMKGRRKEMTKQALHDLLKKSFAQVHSEYGMTELLSQAYSFDSIFFETPPSMKVYLRNPNDPFDINNAHKYGGVNVVDLANIDSCCFVETKDLGQFKENKFQILGRFDYADLRGCNLMVV